MSAGGSRLSHSRQGGAWPSSDPADIPGLALGARAGNREHRRILRCVRNMPGPAIGNRSRRPAQAIPPHHLIYLISGKLDHQLPT
jgi:hypothetical protein